MLQLKSFTFNPFQENTYLLIDEVGEALIIDPGMYAPQEFEIFEKFLREEQITPISIINTHAHIDHILGVTFLKLKYQIPFELHEKEIPVLQSAANTSLLFGIKLDAIPVPDKLFKGNKEQIIFGETTINVLHTPGHSPGSVSFYIPDQKMILSGDVLFKKGIGRTDLPLGNYDQLVESIETALFHLPGDTRVFSGHGPSTTIETEIKEGYLASLQKN